MTPHYAVFSPRKALAWWHAGPRMALLPYLSLARAFLRCKAPTRRPPWLRYGLRTATRHPFGLNLMFLQLLERETSREKLLASRMRELSLQQRLKSARPAASDGESAPVEADDEEV